MGMELKCRTDLDQGHEFANRFHKDLTKIARIPNTPCILYAIGLGRIENTKIEYNNASNPNKNRSISICYEEVVQGLCLIYACVTYPRAH